MDKLLRNFRFATIRLTLAPRQDLVFTEFPGFTLHRAFGRALQTASCKDDDCNGSPCLHPDQCGFGMFWDRKADELTPKKFSAIPCPVILSLPRPSGAFYPVRGGSEDEGGPPEVRQPVAWPKGHPLELEIVLIGQAMDHLKLITQASDLMCRRFGLGPNRVKLESSAGADEGLMLGGWDDLVMPGESTVVALVRDGRATIPTLGTILRAGDELHMSVLASASQRLMQMVGGGR